MGFEMVKSILFGLTATMLLIKIIRNNNPGKEELKYLIYSFLMTIVFFLAIAFNVHHLLRSAFNIPNTLTFLAVFILFLYYAIKFRDKIVSSYYIFLILSIALLTIAGLVDLISDAKIISFSGLDVIEELFSAAGALFWLLFFFHIRPKADFK